MLCDLQMAKSPKVFSFHANKNARKFIWHPNGKIFMHFFLEDGKKMKMHSDICQIYLLEDVIFWAQLCLVKTNLRDLTEL